MKRLNLLLAPTTLISVLAAAVAVAAERSASLRLAGTVPTRMGIRVQGGEARLDASDAEGGGSRSREGFSRLATVRVSSNSGESYAVYVSSDNSGRLKSKKGDGGSELPYELVQGDGAEKLGIDQGGEVRAWLSSPDQRGLASSTHSLQVRIKPSEEASAASRAPASSDAGLLRDTVRLTIVSY